MFWLERCLPRDLRELNGDPWTVSGGAPSRDSPCRVTRLLLLLLRRMVKPTDMT